MKDNQFNTDIQNKFRDFEMPVDQDELWSAISSEIPTNKERRKPFFLLLGIALVSILGITLLFTKSTSTSGTYSNPNKTDSVIASYSIEQDQLPTEKTTERAAENTEEFSSKDSKQVVSAISSPQENTLINNDQHTTHLAQTNTQIIGRELNAPNKRSKKNLEQDKSAALSSPALVTDNSNIRLYTLTEQANTRNSTIKLNEKILNTEITRLSIQLNKLTILHSKNLTIPKQEIPPISVLTPSSSRLFFQGSIFAGITNRQLNANSIESSQYRDLISENERPIYSMGAQLAVGYRINKHWSLMTGINYSKTKNRLLYRDDLVTTTTVIDSITRITTDGFIEQIPERFQITETTQTEYKRYTRLIQLSAPLLIEYGIKSNSGLGIYLSSGILFNLTQRAEGSRLNPDQSIVKYNNSTLENPYGTRASLSYQIGVDLRQSISSSIELGLGGFYRRQGNLFNNEYQLNSTNNSINAALSIRVGL